MKTLLALVLGIVSASAYAVPFTWTSDAKVTFGGTALQTAGNTATAHLVYLGTDGAWSFGDDISGALANMNDTSVQTASTRTTGSNTLKGKIMPTDYNQNGNQGYSYGVMLTYTDSNNDIWYNMSSDIYTIASDLADNATGQSHSFTFSFANGGEVNQLASSQVGSGWYKVVPVPEPGSAAMALLGLGMLIRRRRKA